MDRSLPPGFRFHPTDEELIDCYLKKKVSASYPDPVISIIADIDLYKFNPWELLYTISGNRPILERENGFSTVPSAENILMVFVLTDQLHQGLGTDKPILSSITSQCLGVKNTLVFYIGRAPKGTKLRLTGRCTSIGLLIMAILL
uniref:NAC transcription factor 56-like n=1 Tax=Nicotiana tabacum TaxID=4097 RepID=A0A1S4BRL8_TOBAC|nr:PREDICTED: NAC transcription factor 56-like [Nicotiana tabacum]